MTMASNSRQPKWDIYEAIILLDGYLESFQKKEPKRRIVKRISVELREMAVNRGVEIDDIYRNENGISYQIQSMESAYEGRKVYVPATKLFVETVDLYRNDREKYLELLKEAKSMIAAKLNNKDSIKPKDDAQDDAQQPEILPPRFTEELLEAAETIVSSYFVNGMRKGAAIARKKFRNAYMELTGEKLSEAVDIDELVSAIGFEYANKFYAVSEANKQRICELITVAVDTGNRVMFYEEVYQQNLDFMTEAGIFSAELLKVVLKRIFPDMRYKRTCFSPEDSDTLEQDIIACYGNELMRTYGEIKECLPYADLYQIRSVCSRNSKFVWAKEETYALTDKIRVSQADVDISLNTVSQDIEHQNFSIFSRISVSESTELNPYVPEAAVREALYIKYLAPIYERKRSIITLPGASFSIPAVMTEHCKGLQEVMLSELQAYEEELSDKSLYSLSVAYDTMIRVDRERFVRPDAIHFDVHAIDVSLSLFVQDRIVPLGSVKSFTSFPEVDGYTWNLFLLDSFCRHKSMRFRTMGGPAKSKAVGAIFPIYMQFDSYNALLAQVAANSDLKLHADDVGAFFTKYAYTLRRIDTSGIVARAQEIRIQEDRSDV